MALTEIRPGDSITHPCQWSLIPSAHVSSTPRPKCPWGRATAVFHRGPMAVVWHGCLSKSRKAGTTKKHMRKQETRSEHAEGSRSRRAPKECGNLPGLVIPLHKTGPGLKRQVPGATFQPKEWQRHLPCKLNQSFAAVAKASGSKQQSGEKRERERERETEMERRQRDKGSARELERLRDQE